MLLFDWGYLGVPIFFVLSGFVIAHSLFARQFSWAGFKTFMVRRFLRIAPAYWASIALTIALDFISSAVRGDAFVLPSLLSLGSHLLFLQDILHQAAISPVYWTLAIEMQFYALFYALLWLNQRWQAQSAAPAPRDQPPEQQPDSSRSHDVFLILAGAIALPSLAMAPQLLSWGKFLLPYWYCFLLGILAHWSLHRRTHYGWLLALLVICGILTAPRPSFFSTYLASSGLTLALLSLASGGWLHQSCGRFTQKLGNLSYSVYLIHGVVFGPFFFLRQRLMSSPGAAQLSSGFGMTVLLDLVSLVGAIALTYAIATLFHHWIERPSLHWNRHLRPQSR